jgi:chemotaxis protein CheC
MELLKTMLNSSDKFDGRLKYLLSIMAEAGIHNAARGMSSMLGEELTVSEPTVRLVSINEIMELLGGPEEEAVGIYLRAERKLSGQIMMVVPYQDALELVDLIMGEPVGTTKQLGRMERSALSELGNLTGSFFLNAVSELTGLDTRPSPPAVMVDMIGAILDILIASWDGLSESVLMIQATFMRGNKKIQTDFWVIPDRSTLEAIGRKGFIKDAE